MEADRWSRRCLRAILALALGAVCVLLSLAASTAPMEQMAGMGQAVTSPTETATSTLPSRGLLDQPVTAASAVAPPAVSGVCDSTCTAELGATCATAVGLAVTTVLVLLLASRRDTSLGELERTRFRVAPCWRRRRTPWTAPSPVSLCVLRV